MCVQCVCLKWNRYSSQIHIPIRYHWALYSYICTYSLVHWMLLGSANICLYTLKGATCNKKAADIKRNVTNQLRYLASKFYVNEKKKITERKHNRKKNVLLILSKHKFLSLYTHFFHCTPFYFTFFLGALLKYALCSVYRNCCVPLVFIECRV